MEELTQFDAQPQEESLDLQRVVGLIRRRHIHFLVPFLAGWLAIWGFGWILANKYTSSAVILLERPNMPKDYVASNIGEDLGNLMESIKQQILNRPRLLGIIDKFHLYGGGGPATADARVEKMRDDIAVDLVHGDNPRNVEGFTVSFTAGSPQLAQQVTTELTDLFIDESVKNRQQASQDTTKFLQSQLENASASLAEQDARVKEYEARHEGELPSQQTTNVEVLSGLQAQLQSEVDALNNAKQQQAYDRELISELKGAKADEADDPTTDTGPGSVAALDAQLEQMRAKMTDLSTHYTGRYPDVLHLRDEIAKTEKERDERIARAKANPGRDSASKPANRTENEQISQAQSHLAGLNADIAARQQEVDVLKEKTAAYQARLNAAPVREQELANLTRGSEQLRANYDLLLKKKNESEMATSMEQMQQGERFRMIDPPSLPSAPSSPNRMKLCGLGLGVGVALGLLVVLGIEIKQGRLYGDRELLGQLPMPILAEVPEIVIPQDQLTRKRQMILGWMVAAAVMIVIAAGSAFTYLHG